MVSVRLRLATAEDDTFCTATLASKPHISDVAQNLQTSSLLRQICILLLIIDCLPFIIKPAKSMMNKYINREDILELNQLSATHKKASKTKRIRQTPHRSYRPLHPSTSSTAHRCSSSPHKESAEETKSQAQADNRASAMDPFHSARRPTHT